MVDDAAHAASPEKRGEGDQEGAPGPRTVHSTVRAQVQTTVYVCSSYLPWYLHPDRDTVLRIYTDSHSFGGYSTLTPRPGGYCTVSYGTHLRGDPNRERDNNPTVN